MWEWYDWRRQRIAQARPNAAHEVLAAWSRRFPSFTLITQNVDGLHERAGTRNVVPYHGSIWEVSCWDRCEGSPASWREERTPLDEIPPRCPHCGGLLRPAVVWFGEPIGAAALEAAEHALDCEVCLVVGTSSLVYPAAVLVEEAGRRGAFSVEINPEATPASDEVDLVLRGPAEDVLPAVEQVLLARA